MPRHGAQKRENDMISHAQYTYSSGRSTRVFNTDTIYVSKIMKMYETFFFWTRVCYMCISLEFAGLDRCSASLTKKMKVVPQK